MRLSFCDFLLILRSKLGHYRLKGNSLRFSLENNKNSSKILNAREKVASFITCR
ncbi:MAG: hypothetical protein SPJ83_07590 [Helicobacter sp.]|nr:hypothetical protein [Helicobacter sp.]